VNAASVPKVKATKAKFFKIDAFLTARHGAPGSWGNSMAADASEEVREAAREIWRAQARESHRIVLSVIGLKTSMARVYEDAVNSA
jgi:hypothetical protein